MRLLFVLLLLVSCTPKVPEPQSDKIIIDVQCPQNGAILSSPQTVQCECLRPVTAPPSGGLLNLLAGAVGFFVKTIFE